MPSQVLLYQATRYRFSDTRQALCPPCLEKDIDLAPVYHFDDKDRLDQETSVKSHIIKARSHTPEPHHEASDRSNQARLGRRRDYSQNVMLFDFPKKLSLRLKWSLLLMAFVPS